MSSEKSEKLILSHASARAYIGSKRVLRELADKGGLVPVSKGSGPRAATYYLVTDIQEALRRLRAGSLATNRRAT